MYVQIDAVAKVLGVHRTSITRYMKKAGLKFFYDEDLSYRENKIQQVPVWALIKFMVENRDAFENLIEPSPEIYSYSQPDTELGKN